MPDFKKRGRSYLLDGDVLPSVTSILDAGFPKPALVTWAARQTAGYAVDHWEELDAQSMSERLRTLERAAWAERDRAAFRGTELHRIGDLITQAQDVDVPPQYEHIAQLYADWLDAWQADVVASERPVVWIDPNGVAPSYAGTFDLIADLADGCRWLLDIKTGSGVYDSHVLQLTGYRYATHMLHASGDLVPMPHVDRVGVVHVRPDAVTLIPVAADARAWRTFQAIRVVASYGTDVRKARDDRRAWPVGRPIEPEVA